jgi:AsmA protein
MTRGRRLGFAAAALAVLLAAAAVAFVALFDANALKVRVADAVRRSTGRELTIAGPVGLTWSLIPTIALYDVSLANPPGMSRPAMAHAARVEARIALLPLLSRQVEVRGVTLVEPDLLLERSASGQPNWLFTPVASAAAPGPAAASAPRMRVSVDAVRIRDGRLGWRSGAGIYAVVARTLTAAAAGPNDPVALSGTLAAAGLGLELKGAAGPLAMIGAGAWPLQAALTGDGVQASANGTMGSDGTMALSIDVGNLAGLSPVIGRVLPPLQDLQASARLTSAGVSDIRGQAGAADLSAWLPGLKLTRMTLAGPASAQPVTFAAEGLAGAAPVAVTASVGTLSALLGGGPAPIQVGLTGAGTTVQGQGTVADLTGRGLDMAVSARVPDLAALGGLAGLALPPVRDIALDTRMSATDAGAIALRAMRLTMPQGDVSGDVVLGRTPRPSMRGTLVSQRLNLDGFAAAAPPATPPGSAPGGPAPPPAGAPPSSARLLPDAPLPFDALRRADADLRIALNEVVWRHTAFHAVTGRLLVQDGRLRLDPLQAQAPGGAIQALVLAEAAAPIPTVALGLQAPGMDAGPLLAAFGAPAATGRMDADIQVKGAGASVRAIAASLDGHAGLAMVDGELDNRWLTGLFGDALRGLPIELKGLSRVRCLALRFDVAAGQATARALLLDASRLHLEGEGGVNLADETLDLRLRTLLRLSGTAIAVPVHLAGPWRSPRPQAAIGGGGQGALVIGAASGPDACPAQLTLARDGRAGPMPAAASAPAEAPRIPKPADLLRSLLR